MLYTQSYVCRTEGCNIIYNLGSLIAACTLKSRCNGRAALRKEVAVNNTVLAYPAHLCWEMKKSHELKKSQEILPQGTKFMQAKIHKHRVYYTDALKPQTIQPYQASGQWGFPCWHAVQLLNRFTLKCKPQSLNVFYLFLSQGQHDYRLFSCPLPINLCIPQSHTRDHDTSTNC